MDLPGLDVIVPCSLRCGQCSGHLALDFRRFSRPVGKVFFDIDNFAMLICDRCGTEFLPRLSKSKLEQLYGQACGLGSRQVVGTRPKTDKVFSKKAPRFVYDSDDYYYIPGLYRPRDDGFLTPVFFRRSVLNKYYGADDSRLMFASTTYGSIGADEWDIPFGLNRNGHVVMWLGDLLDLPLAERHYLRSENIPSDHSIGSEFYEAQIGAKYTQVPAEQELFARRSAFLEACHARFGRKFAHMDAEIHDLALKFNAPVSDTLMVRKHVYDTLNKIYVESYDTKSIGGLLREMGRDPKDLGSLKLLQAVLETVAAHEAVATVLCPFFVLYDLRVAHLHMMTATTKDAKIENANMRVGLGPDAAFFDTWRTLVTAMGASFEAMTDMLKTS